MSGYLQRGSASPLEVAMNNKHVKRWVGPSHALPALTPGWYIDCWPAHPAVSALITGGALCKDSLVYGHGALVIQRRIEGV